MNYAKLFGTIVLSSMTLMSCKNDDEASNVLELNVPETYSFERDGQSTISYGGQSTRLKMYNEISSYIKNKDNWPISASHLQNMYANTNSPFTATALNEATTKQLRNKTAASKFYYSTNSVEQAAVRSYFEDILDNAAASSVNAANYDEEAATGIASPGVAGVVEGKRLVDGNGLEPGQLFAKGLLGAAFLDQISNNYTSLEVLDEANNVEDNNNSIADKDGVTYTTMEHKWDEAYGYIYGLEEGSAWTHYIAKVDGNDNFKGIADDIEMAFRKGRAAIVAHDYVLRDQQADVLREKLALVLAVRGVYYLQAGKTKLAPTADTSFHALSEGLGFIYSLAFTQNPSTDKPYFSLAEVNQMINDITSGENGLWDVDVVSAKIDAVSLLITAKFGITVEQAK